MIDGLQGDWGLTLAFEVLGNLSEGVASDVPEILLRDRRKLYWRFHPYQCRKEED